MSCPPGKLGAGKQQPQFHQDTDQTSKGRKKYKIKLLDKSLIANRAVFRGLCGRVFVWCLGSSGGVQEGEKKKLEEAGDPLPFCLAQLYFYLFHMLDF